MTDTTYQVATYRMAHVNGDTQRTRTDDTTTTVTGRQALSDELDAYGVPGRLHRPLDATTGRHEFQGNIVEWAPVTTATETAAPQATAPATDGDWIPGLDRFVPLTGAAGTPLAAPGLPTDLTPADAAVTPTGQLRSWVDAVAWAVDRKTARNLRTRPDISDVKLDEYTLDRVTVYVTERGGYGLDDLVAALGQVLVAADARVAELNGIGSVTERRLAGLLAENPDLVDMDTAGLVEVAKTPSEVAAGRLAGVQRSPAERSGFRRRVAAVGLLRKRRQSL